MNWMIHHSVAWCLSAHLLSSSVPYSNLITEISCTSHINPALVAGIIAQESRFDPTKKRVENRIHDVSIGLMQITTRTARWMGLRGSPRKLYNPAVNITYGVRYLSLLLQKHPYGVDAVAAYNAGTPRWRHGGYVNSRGSLNVERYVVRVVHWTRRFTTQAKDETDRMIALSRHRKGESSSAFDRRFLAWLAWPPGTLYPNIGG